MKRSLLGGDEPVVLTESSFPLTISDVSRDGRAVFFNEYGHVDADVLKVPTDGGGKVERVVSEPLSQSDGVLSPDGHWIAYTSNESGASQVCVRPVGRRGGRVQISPDGGARPEWSADGRELYYLAGNSMVATKVSVSGDAIVPEATRRLLDVPSVPTDSSERPFDLDPTGDRFLLLVPTGESNEMREIAVRLNWTSTLTH